MIQSGSKCSRFHCRASQNPWPPSPSHIHTVHTPLFSGAIQLSLVVRSQAPSKAVSGWWSSILQAIVGVPGAGSSQIWSSTKVERGLQCRSRDLRGWRGRERKGVWKGCFALSYYITHRCWGWKVHERTNHIKYPTWHLRFPLYVAIFSFSCIFIPVYLSVSCSVSLANFFCVFNTLFSARLLSFFIL